MEVISKAEIQNPNALWLLDELQRLCRSFLNDEAARGFSLVPLIQAHSSLFFAELRNAGYGDVKEIQWTGWNLSPTKCIPLPPQSDKVPVNTLGLYRDVTAHTA